MPHVASVFRVSPLFNFRLNLVAVPLVLKIFVIQFRHCPLKILNKELKHKQN